MANPTFANNIRELWTGTTTSTITLSGTPVPGPPGGWRTFAGAGVTNGVTVEIHIQHQTAAEWQTAVYTYDSGAGTLTYVSLLASSTGSQVTFSAGTKHLGIVVDAATLNWVWDTQYAVVPTAAGTTTLTVASKRTQRFTGSTTQTVVMPVASTLTLGDEWKIINDSTGQLTVNSSGSNLISYVAAGETLDIICIQTSGTDTSSWAWYYSARSSITDKSSGVLTGGALSIGTGGAGVATSFTIAAGTGQIVDNTVDPTTLTNVSWSAQTDVSVTNILTQLVTFVAIDSGGNVVQSGTDWTPAQMREYIVIGVVVHSNQTTVNAVNQTQIVSYGPGAQLNDLMYGLGLFNVSGNTFSPNGANLKINKSAGSLFRRGSNYTPLTDNPHIITTASLTQASLRMQNQTGAGSASTTDVDVANYDIAGVTTAISPATRFSILRVFLFQSNLVAVQRGQATYLSLAEAKAAIQTENYTTNSILAANGLLRGFIVSQANATSLSDASKVFFIEAGRFGGSAGVGGLSVSTLQNAYDNSSTPEILTDATRLGMTLKRGSGADTDVVLEGQNGAGTTTFSVTGNGVVSGVLTNCTGLPISTGVSGLGTSVATFLATPSSANLAAALTDETGTGANVHATSPTLVTPVLGTPASGNLSNCTGYPGIKEVLTNNRTYYVRTDGSDSNTGLANTAGGAFLTIQKAVDVASALNIGQYVVTIQLNAGTRTNTVALRPHNSSNNIVIVGDETTPSNCVQSVTSNHCFYGTLPGCAYSLRGMKLQTTTYGSGIYANYGATLSFQNINFGALGANSFHNIAYGVAATITATGAYTISGGAYAHWAAYFGGAVFPYFQTVTLTGTPAFTQFAYAYQLAMIQCYSMTFSGSATGQRYYVDGGSVINTGSGSTTYLPGNSAGAGTNFGAAPWGLYL